MSTIILQLGDSVGNIFEKIIFTEKNAVEKCILHLAEKTYGEPMKQKIKECLHNGFH